MRILSLTLVLCASTARGEEPAPDETAEIEKALQADQAAKAKGAAASASAPAAATGGGGAVARFFQSLNPDLSAIVTLAGGYYSNDDGTTKSGDDPGHTGFNVQEVEVALQAVVDPYFRADVFLTIPNLAGLEVEPWHRDPSRGPGDVATDAGNEHDHQQGDGEDEQRSPEPAPRGRFRPRGHPQSGQADGEVETLLHGDRIRVAVGRVGADAGGGQHHHEPDRQQQPCADHHEVVRRKRPLEDGLGLRCTHARALTAWANRSPRCL